MNCHLFNLNLCSCTFSTDVKTLRLTENVEYIVDLNITATK